MSSADFVNGLINDNALTKLLLPVELYNAQWIVEKNVRPQFVIF